MSLWEKRTLRKGPAAALVVCCWVLLLLTSSTSLCFAQTAEQGEGFQIEVIGTSNATATTTGEAAEASSSNATEYYDSSSYENGGNYSESSAYGDSSYAKEEEDKAKKEKKKDYGDDFKYGAMSVAVLTLGLVVFVEAILHKIDMSALHKPFYQAVLDAVYRELAVLGIVELGIHIMQQYYEYDKDKKAVFADVHFLLFYTDICNALQAVIQAYFTKRVSNRLWVQTEELELDHYVEIREEYERVRQSLYDPQHNQNNLGFLNPNRIRLKMAYRKLLVQVNFHELRVHFLEAYNLPINLRVSDYLMKSEQSVMIQLAHVSPAAWIWLTAICNLMYYLAGLLADITDEAETSGQFYSICFFVGVVVFVLGSILVDRKMRRVFLNIMKAKHLWAFSADNQDYNQDEELADEQRSLFWLADPQWILTSIQFIQLGYAIALSTVFVYWEDMQKDDDFKAYWYLVGSIVCYAAFVYVMARVIPMFTLCSSLGQLVDPKLLHESVAKHKLKEVERYREQQQDEEEDGEDDFFFGDINSVSVAAGFHESMGHNSHSNMMTTKTIPTSTSSGSDSSSPANSTAEVTVASTMTPAITPSVSVSDLIQMDNEQQLLQNSSSDLRRKRRVTRQKARSDGVSLMQQMKAVEEHDEGANSDDEAVTRQQSRSRRKSMSEGVSFMRDESSRRSMIRPPSRETLLADLVRMDLQSVRSTIGKEDASSKSSDSGKGGSKKVKSTSASSLVRQMRAIASTGSFTNNEDDAAADGKSLACSEVRSVHRKKPVQHEEPKEPFSLNKTLVEFFQGYNYRLFSHVLGTMICFFLVAMRVEGFLQKQCIVPEEDYSWDLPLKWTFLLELIWLCVELAGSLVVLVTFGSKSHWYRRDYKSTIAAVMNIAIVTTCLGLLLGAEAQRCCEDPEGTTQDSYVIEDEADTLYRGRFLQYDDYEKEVCVDATLECTCADFGYRVYGGLGSMEPWTALIALQAFRFLLASEIVKWLNLGVVSRHKHHHDHGHGHGHGSGVNTLKVIANAWQEAVAHHPDLVAKYGEFSGELLQAMLQLDVVERQIATSGGPMLLQQSGRPDDELAVTSVHAPAVAQVQQLELCTYPFDFPSAHIIRSIRRCDRMYVPLLSQWHTVDVILTKHEMIYLDVNDEDESMEASKTRAKSLQKMSKTKGGKGLRLNEVTAGRRVLGHLNLKDIVKVLVEREMPSRSKSTKADDIEATSPNKYMHELWEPSHAGDPVDGDAFARRWDEVQQDRLKIDTQRGTLYLRFYSDLMDEENHPERAAKEAVDKTLFHTDNAFNWAQTIVRICVDQLKQPLPHFGDGDSGELRDYLHMVSC